MDCTTMARREITGKKPAQTADEGKRSGPPTADAPIEPTTKNESEEDEPPPADAAIEPTTKNELEALAKTRAPPIRGPPVPPAWYSIREFCQAHRLSVSMFFKLRAQGLAPRETAVGARRYVSVEAAARWRAEREAATQETDAA
jgi:hypothetical protein